jgi:hypothetical protein
VLIIVLLVIALIAGYNLGRPTEITPSSASTSRLGTPSTTSSSFLAIGEPIVVKGIYDIPIRVNFTDASLTPRYQTSVPKQGYYFVLVNFTEQNIGNRETSIISLSVSCFEACFELRADKGYYYRPSFEKSIGSLLPEEIAGGAVVFELIGSARPLEMDIYLGSNTPTYTLTFSTIDWSRVRIGQSVVLPMADDVPMEVAFSNLTEATVYEGVTIKEGYVFLIVEFEARNLGITATHTFPTYYYDPTWELRTDRGYAYSAGCGFPDCYRITVNLGETEYGRIVFQIPADSIPVNMYIYASSGKTALVILVFS